MMKQKIKQINDRSLILFPGINQREHFDFDLRAKLFNN